ncbi:MAG TPA: hypothetical protein VEK57_04560 [Thermoanaerobaculia bacterium]|nr:hypothetical protein [Thermoanaerobaculia bacterium]
MTGFDDFLGGMDNADLRHLTLLLLLYTHHRHGPRHDAHALVVRAIDEALSGKHQHLLQPGQSLDAYLASVIDAIA